MADVCDGFSLFLAIAETLKVQKRDDGTPVYTPLVGITIMVFYVLALQCVEGSRFL